MQHLVTFVGDPKNPKSDPDSITFRGVTFPQGEAVGIDVATTQGADLVAKLKGNSHFRVETVAETDAPAETVSATDDPAQSDEAQAKRAERAAKKAAKEAAEA